MYNNLSIFMLFNIMLMIKLILSKTTFEFLIQLESTYLFFIFMLWMMGISLPLLFILFGMVFSSLIGLMGLTMNIRATGMDQIPLMKNS